MRKIKLIIASLAMVFGLALAIAPITANAAGIGGIGDTCTSTGASTSGSGDVCDSAKKDNLPSMVKIIVNTLLYIVGAVSVVMIIVGGIRFTTSAGNENSIKAARGTVTYAVVGLVVAFLAFAIVNWVLKNI